MTNSTWSADPPRSPRRRVTRGYKSRIKVIKDLSLVSALQVLYNVYFHIENQKLINCFHYMIIINHLVRHKNNAKINATRKQPPHV